MSYSVYIPNIDAWKQHFKHPPKGNKKFYTISTTKQQHGEDMEPIKLVTPTQSVVEQARSNLKRMRRDEDAQRIMIQPNQKKAKKFQIKSNTPVKKKKTYNK